jgi:diguanylate cyclase (GGDEF)-like protein
MNALQSFRHILVIDDQKARRIVALEEQSYAIGRELSNEIVIYDQLVSRHHATLLRIKTSPFNESYCYRIIDGDLQGNKSKNGIIINGKKADFCDLKHGDSIVIGNYTKASYYIISDSLGIALFNPFYCSEFEALKSNEISMVENHQETLINHKNLEKLDQNDLVRLASFPELSPNPIIEIDFQGNITYLNPAANFKFDNIQEAQLEHPLLAGLLNQTQNIQGNLLLREVEIGKSVFEQYVHYLKESQVIRSYLFDVTERKRSEQDLQYRALHDPLTSLPNRAFFDEQLEKAIANAKRDKTLMAVMFLDLDEFKNINDTFGHKLGDQLLQLFARRLQSCLRAGDTVARWGGDEFTLLLPQIHNAEDTIKLAQRILRKMRQPFEIAGCHLEVKNSVGIALYPQDGVDGETLVKNADAALFRAKEQGRNHFCFYSSTMTSKTSLLLKLDNLLAQALEKEELSLSYQPQVNLQTGEITGMEALLCWSHPELGEVPPAQLLPLAEKTDLIVPLGEWVLSTACGQNKAWQNAGLPAIPVAVNLSPRQFQQPNLVKMVGEVLETTGLEPQFLALEITEISLMQNLEFARQVMQKLKQIGIQLYLDNFGTGYSPLSYLQKFPWQSLKIDRSCLEELNSQETAMVSASLALGRSFNLRAIAAGIETLAQLEWLKRLQCQEGQGNWLSPPLQPQEATQFLAKKKLSQIGTEEIEITGI